MNTKFCPYCGGEISQEAKKCRHCNRWLNQEASSEPAPQQSAEQSEAHYSKTSESLPPLSEAHMSFSDAMLGQFDILKNNALWFLLNVLVYVLTIWIPYLNIGTTIAMFHLPSLLASDTQISRIFIFDSHYRKYMIEVLQLLFTKFLRMFCLGLPSLAFGGVPIIILSIRWRFTEVLLLDMLIQNKKTDPDDVMTRSAHYSYGFNWLYFVTAILTNLALIIITVLLSTLLSFMASVVILLALVLFISLNQTREAIFYKHLILHRH